MIYDPTSPALETKPTQYLQTALTIMFLNNNRMFLKTINYIYVI